MMVAEIQKMSPSTTERCSRHAAAVLSNKGAGTAKWERSMATRNSIRHRKSNPLTKNLQLEQRAD